VTESGALPRPLRTPQPLIQVQKLTKFFPVRRGWFGRTHLVRAVNGVSFYVRHAETLGIVGESGCGKTTLGRTMLRLLEPTFGRIVFDGQDVTPLSQGELRPLRKRMQIVFPDPSASLHPRMTVRALLAEPLRAHRLVRDRGEQEDRISTLLRNVGLRPEWMHRYPHELSAGQRQRLSIARALAVEPQLLVCDDPFGAVDASNRARIVNLLLELQENADLSVLLATRDAPIVEYMSHRVAVMYLGRVVELGPTRSLFDQPYHPHTHTLLGQAPASESTPPQRSSRLTSQLPSAFVPPSGCAFHPRCPRAIEGQCGVEEPELRELDPNSHHWVACHNPIA